LRPEAQRKRLSDCVQLATLPQQSIAQIQAIIRLKEAREITGTPLAIMVDTKGPEIRIGKIKEKYLELNAGHNWRLVGENVEGDEHQVTIRPASVLKDVNIGTRILFDNGYIAADVIEKDEHGVTVVIRNHGILSSNKGVNIPNTDIDLPILTEQDVKDIQFACKHDVDFIAASFVRNADQVLKVKKLLAAEGRPDILVISKIENLQGIHNFDSIVQASDGIMIARGDLGVEISLSQVPRYQKMMIRKCYLSGKPAITATQMLESMITHPRPTRAETSDVANAIYDSTSCVMLSGETAVGKYPLEVVNVMRSIIIDAEADFDYRTFFQVHAPLNFTDVPSAVTLATVKTAYNSGAKAIFAFTTTGSTARILSRLRPSIPIIAMTHNRKCYNQMGSNWGVVPFFCDPCSSIKEAFEKISAFALSKGYVDYGDLVVVTAGSTFGISGTTNMMIVESIGDVLIRGKEGFGQRIYGNVRIVNSADAIQPYQARSAIVVLRECDYRYLPFLQEAAGIILENVPDDQDSGKYLQDISKQYQKPIILNATGAMRILKEGLLVTMDPSRALVYKGVVL
jgi:pyruvate kinase